MILDYKIQSLDEVLRDFVNVSGIEMMIRDTEFRPLFQRTPPVSINRYCEKIHTSKEGRRLCNESDISLLKACAKSKRPEYHVCHAGLIDIGIPIQRSDEILGYLILGQIRRWENFHNIEITAKAVNIPPSELSDLYESLPIFDNDSINSLIHVATMLAEHILLSRLMKPKKLSNLENVVSYIDKNLFENLSISKISEAAHVSKSLLYRLFDEHFGMTVSEYINKKRVREACELLSHTDLSIERIAYSCGFSGVAYFSRTFKGEMGASPIKYRKSLNPKNKR